MNTLLCGLLAFPLHVSHWLLPGPAAEEVDVSLIYCLGRGGNGALRSKPLDSAGKAARAYARTTELVKVTASSNAHVSCPSPCFLLFSLARPLRRHEDVRSTLEHVEDRAVDSGFRVYNFMSETTF